MSTPHLRRYGLSTLRIVFSFWIACLGVGVNFQRKFGSASIEVGLSHVSETKNQPKDRSFRPDVRRSGPPNPWKNKHFGTDMPHGFVHEKNFGLKNFGLIFHWEIKGRFRKRVVLANVPSFRFSFRGNIRRNHPFGNHPFANPRKFSLGDKRAVSKRVVLANVPSFRFSFRGTSAETTLLETTLLRTPEKGSFPNISGGTASVALTHTHTSSASGSG